MALFCAEIGRIGGGKCQLWCVWEGDIAAVVAFVDHGFDACRVELWCRIDMGKKGERGGIRASGAWQRGQNRPIRGERDPLCADLFQLAH